MADVLTALVNAQSGINSGIRADRLTEERLREAQAVHAAREKADALTRMIGGQMAAGDLPGARTAAYEGGALDTGNAIDKLITGQDKAAADKQQAFQEHMGQFAGQLLNLPPEQREPTFQAALPSIQRAAHRAGVDLGNDFGYDENELRAFATQYGKGGQGFTLRPGDTRFGASGEKIASVPASQAAANAKPTYGVIGQDQYGANIYGWRNPATGEVTPAQAGGAPSQAQAAPPVQPGLTGEAFLKTLPANMATQVKALDEGRMIPPTSRALKTAYWQRLLDYTSQYDPSFDFNDYRTRYGTRKDFTSGVAARNITAHNTALQHLRSLTKAADKLNNSGMPIYNWVSGFVSRNVGLDQSFKQAVSSFETAKKAVADEMAKVFAGSSSALADRQEWEKKFSNIESPEALKGAVGQAMDLLHSRLQSLADQYNRGMGSSKEPIDLLAPKAREAYNDVMKWAGGGETQQAAPVEAGGPKLDAKDEALLNKYGIQ